MYIMCILKCFVFGYENPKLVKKMQYYKAIPWTDIVTKEPDIEAYGVIGHVHPQKGEYMWNYAVKSLVSKQIMFCCSRHIDALELAQHYEDLYQRGLKRREGKT